MASYRVLLLLFCLSSATAWAQPKFVKPVKTHSRNTRISFGAGVTNSVLFLSRNIKEDNEALGLNLNLTYGISRLMRAELEYTRYREIAIAPTWYDIRAYTVEANLHFISKFPESKAYFYPMFGVSYNVFSGFFTGVNDFLNLAAFYESNSRAVTRWVGVNTGLGIERFFGRVSVFGECKMRTGISEEYSELTIMDVCYSAGVRLNLRARSVYGLFRGTRSRYLLRTQEKEDW
jgi:hypothetical protein